MGTHGRVCGGLVWPAGVASERVLVSSLVWVGLSLCGFGVSQDGEETLLLGDDGTLS